jgi:hypothetical protein
MKRFKFFPFEKAGVWLFAVLALLAFFPLTGCKAMGKAEDFLLRKTPTVVRAAQTNVIERVVTNYITSTRYLTNLVTIVAATTNAAGEVLVPAIVQPQIIPTITRQAVLETNLEVLVRPAVVVTNYGLAPTVVGAVQQAGDLAPVPWGGALGSGLVAVASIAFGWFNRRRALKALGEKETWETAASVVVDNFETLRRAALQLPEYAKIDARVMKIVKGDQLAAGVKPEITSLVDANTDHTLPLEIHQAPTATA